MFFFLSKTLGYLSQPLVIIGGLFLLALVVRSQHWKRICLVSGIALFFFLSNDFIANEIAQWWEPEIVPFSSIQKKYEYGIVLTGVTRAQVGPNDRVYFQRGADRITHTLQLYKQGIIRKILISGGTGRLVDIGWREADDLASFLKLANVPDSVVVLERASSNTHESAVEVAKLLKGATTSSECLLITSGYHLPRSRACFAKEGMIMDIFATDPLAHERLFHLDILLLPKLEAFSIWNTLIREWVGMIAYKLAGYI